VTPLVTEHVEGVDVAAERLDALSSRATSPFQTSAWLRAWAAAWEPDAAISSVSAFRDGELVGTLPLAWLRRPLHPRVPVPVRYLGVAGSTGGADHLGPVVADRSAVEALLGAATTVAGRWPVLLEHLAPEVAEAVLAAGPSRAVVVRLHPCPVLDLEPDPEATWSSKLRKSIRRRARLLDDAGWSTRWVEERSEVAGALDLLRARHHERWGDRMLAGSFDDRRDRLLRALIERWRGDGGPAIQVLRHPDGRVGAVQLVLRHRGTWSVYKTGWNPDLAPLGPGVHLAVEAVRSARAAGAAQLDFLRGVSPYKYSLGAVDRFDQSVALRSSLGGRLLAVRERLSERRATRPAAPT
jgi:CelD/BcsL family acetyltransferase involved in cellulose biosynthesis